MYHPKLFCEGVDVRARFRFVSGQHNVPDNDEDKDLETGLYHTCATPLKVRTRLH